MKITSIRKNGKKIHETLLPICQELEKRFKKAGFITGVEIVSNTTIRIGQHMRSFSLDLSKHDRNLQCSPYAQKLTNLPTWDQRVVFNNIVNAVLNKYKISANVKSGPFVIRKGLECMTESDWHDQTPEHVRHNMARGYYIEPIDEKQYLEERRIRRNREAAYKRNMAKQSANITQESVPTLSLVRG